MNLILIAFLFSSLVLADSTNTINTTRLASGNDKIYRSTITNSMFDELWIKQVFGLCPEVLLDPTADCLQPILDPNNPLVFHSQKIINTIDGALRKQFPKSFLNIPTPQVLMNPSKEFNASALGSEVCYQVNVALVI
jgi:hypothetical protein